MYAYIQFLGVDPDSLSPSFLVFFDDERYLFNCGEGMQRFCGEYGISISKIKNIFITRVCADTVGGLPGLLLTRAESGNLSMSLHGSTSLIDFMNATSIFLSRNNFNLELHDCSVNPTWHDNNLTVIAVALLPLQSLSSITNHTRPSKKICVNKMEYSSPSIDTSNPNTTEKISNFHSTKKHIVLCYICFSPDIPGKFDVKKARDLGINPSRLYGELQRGHQINLSDGTVINPSQVMSPSTPGVVFIVIDCPNVLYFPSLKEKICTEKGALSVHKISNRKILVIHFTPSSLFHSKPYQQWCYKTFISPFTKHVVFPTSCGIPIYLASTYTNYSLSKLCPLTFSELVIPISNNPIHIPSTKAIYPSQIIIAQPLLKFTFAPLSKFGFDSTNCLSSNKIHTDAVIYLNGIKKNISCLDNDNSDMTNNNKDNPYLVFLGTGAAQPSKYRNVSSILLRFGSQEEPNKNPCQNDIPQIPIPSRISDKILLLDCGEGTWSQIVRVYGQKAAIQTLSNTVLIWISHIHADHHLGLMTLLSRYQRYCIGENDRNSSRLIVVGPNKLNSWLNHFQSVCFDPIHFLFLSSSEICDVTKSNINNNISTANNTSGVVCVKHNNEICDHPNTLNSSNSLILFPSKEVISIKGGDLYISHNQLKSSHLNLTIRTVVVPHCPESYGIIIECGQRSCENNNVSFNENDSLVKLPDNLWKLVYSGDSRPSPELITAGKNATVLIHEATFEEGLEVEAMNKMHSTIPEAINVAKEMNAMVVILTHFSQRYPKIPLVNKGSFAGSRVIYAFDLMHVGFNLLLSLPRLSSIVFKVLQHASHAIETHSSYDQ